MSEPLDFISNSFPFPSEIVSSETIELVPNKIISHGRRTRVNIQRNTKENCKTTHHLTCNYCDRHFTRKNALIKHYNYMCGEKTKREYSGLMEKIDLLLEKNEKLKQSSSSEISKVSKSKTNYNNIVNNNQMWQNILLKF